MTESNKIHPEVLHKKIIGNIIAIDHSNEWSNNAIL
jgi:hypothetical protein